MRTYAIPALCFLFTAPGAVLSQVEIDPTEPTGAIVQFFGWDLKGWEDVTSTPKRANKLYGETPANLVRIPIHAIAHRQDGSVDEGVYGPLLKSIKNIRVLNPEVKIFASLKLKNEQTFPAWVESNETAKIFDATVKRPDPEKFARLVAGYIDWLRGNGVAIDYLGLNNEVSDALTAERYVATAKALMKELDERGVPREYRDFRFVGGEGFSVSTSVRYAETIKKERGLDYAHVWGSHFYPDFPSGSIDDWDKLARVSPDRPLWHTEIHVRDSDNPADNIAKIRDGLALLFKTNQKGVQGYVWWARAHEDNRFANLIRHKVVTSLLYGSCVETSGHYRAKDNRPEDELAQATRVGDTAWLWYCNPGPAKAELRVPLKRGQIKKVSGEYWTGGKKASRETEGTLDVEATDASRALAKMLPATSIALIRIDLADDAASQLPTGN